MEALEKRMSVQDGARQTVSRQVLSLLPVSTVEHLIGAFGGERVGRQLSQDESAARQAYLEAVDRECRRATVVGGPQQWERGLDIYHAVITVLAESLSSESLELVSAGCEAEQQGRALDQYQAEALQAYAAEWARLCQRSGFSSRAEFEQYCRSKSCGVGYRS